MLATHCNIPPPAKPLKVHLKKCVDHLENLQCTTIHPIKYGPNLLGQHSKEGQNSRRFADDTLKRFFLNENVFILIKISLKFVPKDPINNIPPLVQTMAYLNRRIYPSLGLNEISYIIGSSGFFLSFCAYFPWFFQ